MAKWLFCLSLNLLTHWVMHICITNPTIIGWDTGLLSSRRQAIIWTNVGILLIWPLGRNFTEMLIEIHIFSFKKMHLKMLSAKQHVFCPSLNVLTLNLQGPSYLSLAQPISWLLMPWLLASPGHQHLWHWPCRIRRSLLYLREDFSYLCHVNVEECYNIQIYVYVPCENLARKELRVNSVWETLHDRPTFCLYPGQV